MTGYNNYDDKSREAAREAELFCLRLGKRIYKARKAAGLTQKELARMVGTSHQAVARYETGETLIPAILLYQIAKALDVNIRLFFDVM